MKISLIQMNSRNNKAANLAAAERLAAEAHAVDGPDMTALPEMFAHVGSTSEGKHAAAEVLPNGANDEAGEAYRMLQELARRLGVYVHGGSLAEKAGNKLFNTTLAFDREGREVARYRKIHLFDVITPDGREYRESATIGRGNDIVTYVADGVTVGCAICYDLRFPEIFQALAKRGTELIILPSAFTLLTGKDHWEALCRARAIGDPGLLRRPGPVGSTRRHGGRRATLLRPHTPRRSLGSRGRQGRRRRRLCLDTDRPRSPLRGACGHARPQPPRALVFSAPP